MNTIQLNKSNGTDATVADMFNIDEDRSVILDKVISDEYERQLFIEEKGFDIHLILSKALEICENEHEQQLVLFSAGRAYQQFIIDYIE